MLSLLKNLKPSKRDALIGLFFAGLGAFGSFLLQDFSEFKTSSREVIKERLSKSDDAQNELLKDLSKLSAKARGKGTLTADEIKTFKENIKSAYTAGQDIVVAVPRIKTDFEAYGDALIKLQSSVDELKGPTTGSAFVEAVSEYAYTKSKFNERAGSFITNWTCTLIPLAC